MLRNRRRFLASGAVAALLSLSGCLGVLGSDGSDGDGDGGERRLQLRLSDAPTPLRSEYVVDFAETERQDDAAAFDAALAGETYTTQHRTPFGSRPDEPQYARHEGAYYRLGSVVVNERAVTHPVVRLSAVASADADDAPAAVDADDLSEADRTVVHVGHVAARARDNEGGVPWGLVQRGGYVFRDDAAAEGSRLIGDDAPSHVAYRGTVYTVEVSRERFHEPVYRATVDPVAESPERMEAILRAQFVDARLSGDALPAEARALLLEARGEGYAESHPYSDAYRAVLTGLHARAYLDGDIERDAHAGEPGGGVVRYDGTHYDYRLRFVTRE
jgi:hypothetical protein